MVIGLPRLKPYGNLLFYKIINIKPDDHKIQKKNLNVSKEKYIKIFTLNLSSLVGIVIHCATM